MNKFSKNIAIILLSSIGIVGYVQAQTCATPPSCATLGYDKSTSDCNGQAMLRCPFDQAKVFCSGTMNGGNEEGGKEACKGLCFRIKGIMYKFKLLGKTCWDLECFDDNLRIFSTACADVHDDGKLWMPIFDADVARVLSTISNKKGVCFYDNNTSKLSQMTYGLKETFSSYCNVGCVTTY